MDKAGPISAADIAELTPSDKARLEEAMHADAQDKNPVKGFKKARMRRIEIMRNPATGLFAVATEGARYACPVPPAYTPERMKMSLCDGRILVAQDGLPTLQCDPQTGHCRRLE